MRHARAPEGAGGGDPWWVARCSAVSGPALSGIVAASLVLAGIVVGAAAHGVTPIGAVSAQVRTAELVCPGPVDRFPGARSTVSVAALPPQFASPPAVVPSDAGSGLRGTATISDLVSPGRNRARRNTPGVVRVDLAGPVATASVVRGTGDLAPGLAAEVVTEPGSGAGSGLSAATCTPPSTSSWFVGASTSAGRRDRLLLMNPEATPASVDLRLWDAGGRVDAPNATDITVPAGGVVSIPLDGMAPGHQRLAVEVITTSGAVSAALHDLDALGSTVNGDDWIAPGPSPQRDLVIPGLPDGTSSRKLYLAAPDGSDAIVKVRLLTTDNDFAPAGADTVALSGGRVGEYDLSASGGGQPMAAVITADRPVVASVRSVRTENGASDTAWSTAAGPLSSSAVVADGRGGTAGVTTLLLTAPTGVAGVVELAVHSGSGPPRRSEVRIPADRVVSITVAGHGAHFAVVVTPMPGSGPVVGARVLRVGRSGLTVTPLLSGREAVVIPAVVPDVTAVTSGSGRKGGTGT